MMYIWNSLYSEDNKYNVVVASMGQTLFRAEVYELIGGYYERIACGDYGDRESATRSFKRYCKKFNCNK